MKKLHSSSADPRWQVLTLVQNARETLGLKGRSITVLRGLMTFITPEKWAEGDLKLFPSNKSLQERCDAMDERTLRRHLAHLCKAGLIERNISPNRKRYVVRDENGISVVSYGFDLSPLRHHIEQLQEMAESAKHNARRLQALKAILRDLLWKTGTLPHEMRKLLRNKTTIQALEVTIEELRATLLLTDSLGQNDRHIQNSNKEYIEEISTPTLKSSEICIQECIEAAKDAVELSLNPITNWNDLHHLASNLAPAIGLTNQMHEAAKSVMGQEGATLAILGMVQSISRIKSTPSYLNSLCNKAIAGTLNLKKMFISLTRPARFPAGNR